MLVENARIIPDGGLIEEKDDNGNWRVVVVSEAKHQGKDIENIQKGIQVGKNKNQDTMVASNAIERAHKNIYTKGEGGHWNDDMIEVMMDVAKTS